MYSVYYIGCATVVFVLSLSPSGPQRELAEYQCSSEDSVRMYRRSEAYYTLEGSDQG